MESGDRGGGELLDRLGPMPVQFRDRQQNRQWDTSADHRGVPAIVPARTKRWTCAQLTIHDRPISAQAVAHLEQDPARRPEHARSS